MKPEERLPRGVPTDVFGRNQPSGRCIRNGQASLQLDELLGLIDGDDEHGAIAAYWLGAIPRK